MVIYLKQDQELTEDCQELTGDYECPTCVKLLKNSELNKGICDRCGNDTGEKININAEIS